MFALVKTVKDNDNKDVTSVKIFAPYTTWEDKHGIQYSADSLLTLSASQKQDLGIYDVAYAPRPDDRFFVIAEETPSFDPSDKIVKITYTSTPKELEDDGDANGLKSQFIAQVKDSANKELASTDWMLVRKIERSVDVPEDVAIARAAIKNTVNIGG